MDSVLVAHVVAAVLLLAACVVVAAWGLTRAGRIAPRASGPDAVRQGMPRESRRFAHALQLSHTLVLLTGLLGVLLLLGDRSPADPLHARVYGPFMLVAIVAAYGFRTADARANIRVFAVASLVILALGLRATWTGG